MIERIDFWRGFTGGLLAGMAIGTFFYFSPNAEEKIAERFGALDHNHNPDDSPTVIAPAKGTELASLSIH